MAAGSLLRSARPLMLGRAGSAVVTFALPVVLARVLDQAHYGTYKQVFLVANLAMYSLQLGLSQSLYYFLPRTGDARERRALLQQTHGILALVGLAAMLGLWLGAPMLAHHFTNPEFLSLGLPTGLLAAMLVASSPLEIALTASGRQQWSAAALVGTDLVRTGAMLVPVLLGYGLPGLVWGAALAAGLRWAVSLVVAGGLSLERPRYALLARQVAYSLPYGAAVLLAMPQAQLHQLYVSAMATPAMFALYAVGCMQIPVVGLLYQPITEVLQVRLAALERTGELHKAGSVFAEAVDRLAVLFLPMCATLIALAAPMLHLLYGAPYVPAAEVMKIAVVSVAISALPVDGVLRARARTGTLLAIYAVKLAATWPAVAAGWRLFGMEGVILAHVLVELATKLSALAIIAREIKVPAPSLMHGARLGRSIVVAGIVGGAAALVSSLFQRPLPALLAGGAAAGVLWVGELMLRKHRGGSRFAALSKAA